MRALVRTLGVTSALILATTDAAAINMTLGDVEVRRLGSYGFTATNSVLSFDSGGTDQLYQMFGYLGNANDTVTINPTYFDVATAVFEVTPGVASSSLILNTAGASALGLADGALRVDYTFRLIDGTSAADLDSFLWDVAVTNLGAVTTDLSLYQYLDLDLNGTFADDTAIADTASILVTDGTDPFVFRWTAARGGNADHFAVQDYPNVRNLLNGMAAATDLPDTGATFGPGDFTGAFQYDFSLAPGESEVLASGSVSVAEPDSSLLAVLGVMGLAIATRRSGKRPEAS